MSLAVWGRLSPVESRRLMLPGVTALALLMAGCSSTYERALAYTDPAHRLTSIEFRDKGGPPEDYPIGTSYHGRRCGNTVGLSKGVFNVATKSITDREPLASSAPLFTDYVL